MPEKSTFADQVSRHALTTFEGVPNALTNHLGSADYEAAGTILAGFAHIGEADRFQSLVQDLAPNPRYQAAALQQALRLSDRDMLPPVFTAIESMNPQLLSLSERIGLLAGITQALLREPTVDAAERPWPQVKVDADTLVEQATDVSVITSSLAHDITLTHPYAANPQEHVNRLVAQVCEYVQSPSAHVMVGAGMFYGQIMAEGVLRGLSALKLEGMQQQLLSVLSADAIYGYDIATHMQALCLATDPAVPALYQIVNARRADFGYMPQVDASYARYLAKTGQVAEAVALVDSLPTYDERIEVRIAAATALCAAGQAAEAAACLRTALNIDPLTLVPFQESAGSDPFADLDYAVNDSESARIFTEEATMRQAMHVTTTRRGLMQRQRVMLELVAVEAANIGDMTLAVEAYGSGEACDVGTLAYAERDIAQAAMERGQSLALAEAIVGSELLDTHAKAGLLHETLLAFNQRPNRFPVTAADAIASQDIQALATGLVQELSDQASYGIPHEAVQLLVQLGRYDEALAATGGRCLGDVVQHMAFAGQPAAAWEYYWAVPGVQKDSLPHQDVMQAIAVNALLLGEEALASQAIQELPTYRRSMSLGWLALHLDDTPLPPLPAAMLNQGLSAGASIKEVARRVRIGTA